MEILVTDPVCGLYKVFGMGTQLFYLGNSFEGFSHLAVGKTLAAAAQPGGYCSCFRVRDFEQISVFPAVCGLEEMCFSPLENYLFQLSSEADCIHAHCLAAGELHFAAPFGVFPRAMRLSRSGQQLIASGGAADEAAFFNLPQLTKERSVYTRRPCFAAEQHPDGLILLCAEKEEDIHTSLCLLPNKGVRARKLMELPGQPGSLCLCHDRAQAIVSTGDGLFKLDLAKKCILWNRPELALCMKMECRENLLLVSALLSENVLLLNHEKPWIERTVFHGTQPQAVFLP